MIGITKENIVLYHKKIIKSTGGCSEIRDIDLIDSAVNRGNITFNGIDLYPSIIEKISAITHSLIKNHPFVDGNKRIGVAVMILLLKLNEIPIVYTQDELIKLGLRTAEGKYNNKDINEWINDHRV